jgi:hypothetical protein
MAVMPPTHDPARPYQAVKNTKENRPVRAGPVSKLLEGPMANHSTGRDLRIITLGLGTWGWVVVTLLLLGLVVVMAQARLFS